MVEQGFPNSHTTATTVQPNTKPDIYMDLSYIRTRAGMLKCAEICVNLLGFICILSSILRHHSRGNWFATVSMCGIWFTGIMLVLYIFHVTDKLSVIPWFKIEFCFCLLWTLFYLIAATLAAGFYMDEAFAAAAVPCILLIFPVHQIPWKKLTRFGLFFGFVAMVLYGLDAFTKFIELKVGRNTVRATTVTTTTTTTTTTN